MKALITGVTGFAASHLAEFLLSKGMEVHGTIRPGGNMCNIDQVRDSLHLMEANMKDADAVERAVEVSRPDYIFHLASRLGDSWEVPVDTVETNVIGTIHLLEAIRKSGLAPKIHIASSSEVYGICYPNELPIKETNPLRPVSPYGVSKVAQDKLAFQYYRSYGLKTIVTRAFIHTGPRNRDVFVLSNFAKQIAEIEKGAEPIIYTGNLDAQREFCDVRDIARAYWAAVEECEFGEVYNICSERTRTIRDILEIMLSMANRHIEVIHDPSRMKQADVEILVGDCSKFRERTGWVPEIPFERTLKDLLDYWRLKIEENTASSDIEKAR